MTRGGVTPPIPPGTPAVQVFADSGCTTRPVEGGVYETLYVRLNRSYGFGEGKDYSLGSGSMELMLVNTPNSEAPDVTYFLLLWDDWSSEEFTTPFLAGSVVPVTMTDPIPVESPFVIDFYDE